jgi:type II secretory pathway pseudopilin PulG
MRRTRTWPGAAVAVFAAGAALLSPAAAQAQAAQAQAMQAQATQAQAAQAQAAQAGAAGMAGTAARHGAPTAVNLIKDHGAEKASPNRHGGVVAIKHWTRQKGTRLTAVAYGTRGFPGVRSPGPGHRGRNFFAGGPRSRRSSATQALDLHADITLIRSGKARFTLAGWLGGFGRKRDYAMVTVTWSSIHGQVLGRLTVGPVTEKQRKGITGLQRRTRSGVVPRRTSRAVIRVTMVRASGSYNDGFADNLSLTISRHG